MTERSRSNGEGGLGVEHHGRRHLRRRHDGDRPFGCGLRQVQRAGAGEDIEHQVGVGLTGADLVAFADLVGLVIARAPNLEVRHHRTALLRQAGLVETMCHLAVEQGSRCEQLVDGDHTGPADPHHEDVAFVDAP
ncbi:MAG: hypothetical protein R2710_23320 [Acidimicrobiales bacterium]